MHLCWTGNWIFRSRGKGLINHPTKHILEKIKNFPKKIENRKQLERFLRCLTYTIDFTKDLATLRKSLQQKLKIEVNWTRTPSDSKIVQNFKKMCKNLHVLNLSNEKDDSTLEINASNKHWSVALKIKEGEKLCKYYCRTFNKAECNYQRIEKEIITVIKEIKKLSIFLASKPFLI